MKRLYFGMMYALPLSCFLLCAQ